MSSRSTVAFGTVAPVLSRTTPVTIELDPVCARVERLVSNNTNAATTLIRNTILGRAIHTPPSIFGNVPSRKEKPWADRTPTVTGTVSKCDFIRKTFSDFYLGLRLCRRE